MSKENQTIIKALSMYRNKHKKCKYCKYYQHLVREVGFDYYSCDKCILKDKIISFPNLRNLCKYYEVKVGDDNEG